MDQTSKEAIDRRIAEVRINIDRRKDRRPDLRLDPALELRPDLTLIESEPLQTEGPAQITKEEVIAELLRSPGQQRSNQTPAATPAPLGRGVSPSASLFVGGNSASTLPPRG